MKRARLGVIIPAANHTQDIEHPSRRVWGARERLAHVAEVDEFHPDTGKWIERISGVGDMTPAGIRREGFGLQCLAGVVDVMLRNADSLDTIVLRFPEAGLHPGLQANLADFLIYVLKLERGHNE